MSSNPPDVREWQRTHDIQSISSPFGGNGPKTNPLGPNPLAPAPQELDAAPTTHYNLYDVYKGVSPQMRDTLVGYVLDDRDSVFVTLALPFAYTQYLSVSWNTWRFNEMIAGRVPPEGISRLISQSKQANKRVLERRGIAFFMEGDALNDVNGPEMWNRNMMGIARTIQETIDFDTVMELLNCNKFYQLWENKWSRDEITWEKILNEEKDTFACVARQANKIRLIYENEASNMEKRGKRPDLILTWPSAKIYLENVAPTRTSFWSVDEGGGLQLMRGPVSMATFTDGAAVFAVRDFKLDGPNKRTRQLLNQVCRITEFTTVGSSDWKNEDNKEYTSKIRDVWIYNQNDDVQSKVSFRLALERMLIFDTDNDTWDKDLVSFIDNYNTNDFRETKELLRLNSYNDDTEDPMEVTSESKKPPLHPLTTIDSNSRWTLPDIFGQIPPRSMSREDLKQICESFFPQFSQDPKADSTTLEEAFTLIDQIESQQYNAKWFSEVIRLNIPDSIDDEGNFIGQNTPDDLMRLWGLSKTVLQWTPSSYGSLLLPNDKEHLADVGAPAGFANGPGLRALAEESNNSESRWYSMGKTAKKVVDLFDRICSVMTTIMRSPATDTNNRPPWFHRPDALASFVCHCITPNRDPIFLPYPRRMKKSGKAMPTGSGIHTRVLPLFESDDPNNPIDKFDMAAEIVNQTGLDEKTKWITYKNVNGVRILFPVTLVSRQFLPRDLLLMVHFGNVNLINEFRDIINRIKAQNEKDQNTVINKLIDHLSAQLGSKGGIEYARKAVKHLTAITSYEQLKNDIVMLSSKVTEAEEAKKKALLTSIVNIPYNPKETDLDKKLVNMIDLLQRERAGAGTASDISNTVEDALLVIFKYLDTMKVRGNKPFRVDEDGITALMAETTKDAKLQGACRVVLDYLSNNEVGIPSAGRFVMEILEQFQNEDEGINVTPSKKLKEQFVIDVEKSVIGATFYRTPLTMSYALLKTMMAEKLPIALPGDPRIGNFTPYGPSSMDTAGIYELPREIYERFEYCKTSDLKTNTQNPHAKRMMESLPWVQRLNSLYKLVKYEDKLPKKDGKREININNDREFYKEFFGTAEDESSNKLRKTDSGGKVPVMKDQYHTHDPNNYHPDIIHTDVSKGWFMEITSFPNAFIRVLSVCFLTSSTKPSIWYNMVDNGVDVPLDAIYWRFIDLEMSSMILMKGGLDTGANLVKGAHWMYGASASNHTIMANVTWWSKSVVTNSENVRPIWFVRPSQYCGGSNVKFVRTPDNLKSRKDRNRPSIVATACARREKVFPTIMSFTGLLPDRGIPYSEGNPEYDWCYTAAAYYNSRYRTQSYNLNRYKDESAEERGDQYYPLGFRGHVHKFNKQAKLYNIITYCQGHRGRNGCGNGAGPVWDGQEDYFKTIDYTELQLQ